MVKDIYKRITSLFYLYDWLKPIVCKYFGHKITVQYMVYEQEKIVKNYDKTAIIRIKHCYDPYFVYSCSRCNKKLGTKRLKRKLTKEQATDFSNNIIKQIQLVKQFKKSK